MKVLTVYRAANVVIGLVVTILMAGLSSDDAQVQLKRGNFGKSIYPWKTRCLETSNRRLLGAIESVRI